MKAKLKKMREFFSKKLGLITILGFAIMLGLPASTLAALPADDFVDVSSWNGNLSVKDYSNLKKHGVKGSVVKLTESTNYFNPYASSQIANAKAAGLQVSAYHYSQYMSENEARAEARFFAQKAKSLGLGSNDVMVNDLEEIRLPNKTGNTSAWFDEMRKQGFNNLMIYCSGSWLDNHISVNAFGKENFWVAAYPYEPGGKKWYTDYAAWQWTSERSFPDVYSAIGRFDMNVDYTGRFTKNAKPGNQTLPETSNPAGNKLVAETGWYSPYVVNNVRSAPSTSASIVAQYYPGESVYYDGYILSEGYVWIHYKSYTGNDRYMAVRNIGQAAWGSFK